METKKIMFGLLLLCLIVTPAMAAFVEYFGQIDMNVNVDESIQVEGELAQEVDIIAGQTANGELIEITNRLDDVSVDVIVTTTEEDGISVSYWNTLEFTTKDTADWSETSTASATIRYRVIGEQFEYEVIESTVDLNDYTLVYYKDAEFGSDIERLGTPAEAISVDSITGNIPYTTDGNIGDTADYCEYDGYDHCKGAKLWLVLTSDLSGNELSWANMGNYLYETDLIHYFESTDGTISIPTYGSIEFYPRYEFSTYLAGGTYSMITSIAPAI